MKLKELLGVASCDMQIIDYNNMEMITIWFACERDIEDYLLEKEIALLNSRTKDNNTIKVFVK